MRQRQDLLSMVQVTKFLSFSTSNGTFHNCKINVWAGIKKKGLEFGYCQIRMRPPSYVEITLMQFGYLLIGYSLALWVVRHWKCRLHTSRLSKGITSLSFTLNCWLFYLVLLLSCPTEGLMSTLMLFHTIFPEHYNQFYLACTIFGRCSAQICPQNNPNSSTQTIFFAPLRKCLGGKKTRDL